MLRLDAPGEVTLRQVRQFVRHDRGVFGFGLCIEEQAAVDPDDSARCGKGVELRAVEQDELQAAILQLAGFRQAVDAGLDEVLELRVVQLRNLATQQAEPGTAELMLLLRRDDRRAGVAKRWQITGTRVGSEQAGQRQQGGAQKSHALGLSGRQRRYCSRPATALARVAAAWVS